MEEYYQVLKRKTEILSYIGFAKTSDSGVGALGRVGISWYHAELNLHFAIVWESRGDLSISCNINEKKQYRPFTEVLDKYKIEHDVTSFLNDLDEIKDLTLLDRFTNALNYWLKKLGELLMVLE